jgi:hypothetical protein
MADKLKVLLHYIIYPLSMGTYFRRALERRDDIDLKVVGVYTGTWIAWKGGMDVQPKYAIAPDIPLPYPLTMPIVADYDYVKTQLFGWKPDLVLTADAGSYWRNKPSEGYVAHIATDPHVLNYDKQRKDSDKFFNMQMVYSQAGDVYLPYAYDPSVMYREEGAEKTTDVCLIGLEYQHRIELVDRLRKLGLRVHFSNGEIFDEYRAINNSSHIGLNWSSLDDLNARAFEIPALGTIPVMNRVTDMGLPQHSYFDFAYLFESENQTQSKSAFVSGAVEKVKYVMDNLEQAKKQTDEMRKLIAGETYDARIQQILDECGMGE